MSAEFPQPQDPTLAERMHNLVAEARTTLGRAAAASLIVVGGGTIAAGVEAAVYPAIAQADAIDTVLANYPDAGMACEHAPYNVTGSCADYDWGPVHTTVIGDPSTFSSRGYGYRNCTDYVAWRVANASDGAASVPTGLHDAKDWYTNSPKSERTLTPKAGEIAVSTSGTFGHVAFVESVSANAATMVVSEYNEDEKGDGDQRTLSTNGTEFTEYIDLGVNLTNSTGSTPAPTPPQPNNNLYFIKTQNTGSGEIEVHNATGSSGYQASDLHAATYFSESEGPNGTWQMWNRNLYFIKTRNTGSGDIEIHDATAASNYDAGDVNAAAPFSEADAANGQWELADIRHINVPDLVFIKERNTGSGHVEVFISDGPNYNQINVADVTAFSETDATNGQFQIENSDLTYIKTQNTGTHTVEYFRAPIGGNYGTVTLATGSVFSPADALNGTFSSEDLNANGQAELTLVKTQNTSSGQVEVFATNGTNYGQLGLASTTYFSEAGAADGTFEIGNGS